MGHMLFFRQPEWGESPSVAKAEDTLCNMGHMLFCRQQECGESPSIGQAEDRLHCVQHGALQHRDWCGELACHLPSVFMSEVLVLLMCFAILLFPLFNFFLFMLRKVLCAQTLSSFSCLSHFQQVQSVLFFIMLFLLDTIMSHVKKHLFTYFMRKACCLS